MSMSDGLPSAIDRHANVRTQNLDYSTPCMMVLDRGAI